MGSIGKLRCVQVILLCVFVGNFWGSSSYRLGKSSSPNSDSSIFKNGRDPLNRKPAYALQNAINAANLISPPGPVSDALAALFLSPSSSTEVTTTVETSSTDSTPADTSSTEASSTTEVTTTVETSSTDSTSTESSSTQASSTTEVTTTVETSSTDSTSTESSSTEASSTTVVTTTVETSSTDSTSTESSSTETASTESTSTGDTSSTTESTTTTTTDSSASTIPDGTSGNLLAETNANLVNFPSLIELIALRPGNDAMGPTVTYSPIFTKTPAITSPEPTSTTESQSSSTDSSSSEPTPTTEGPSSSTDSSSSEPTPTTEGPSSSTDSTSPEPTQTTEGPSSSTDSSSPEPTPTTEGPSSSTDLSSPEPTPTTEGPSSSTDSTSPEPTPTTEGPSSSTDSSSPEPTPTTEGPSSSTDSSSPEPTPTTEGPSSSTDSTSPEPTQTTEGPSSSTDSSSPEPTPTTEGPTSSTDSSSSEPTPTTEGPSSSTDSTSPEPTPTTEGPTSSTDSSSSEPTPTTEGPTSSTDSSSPEPSPTTDGPSSSTEPSTPGVSPTPATDSSSSPTDSTPSSTTDPSPIAPALIVGQKPNVLQLFPGFNQPSSGSPLIPTLGGNPGTANDSPFGQIQEAASQLNIPSIFNSTAGGLSSIASLPNLPPISPFGDAPIANDSPIEQIQTTASQLLAAGNIPYVFNTTSGGLNAITSIPSNAGINIPQLPIFSDGYVANDTPLNQIQTAASQLLTSSNIPSIFNETTSGLNAIASLPNITGINIPTIPTLGDAPVASDTPINLLQATASQLQAEKNPSSAFNKTAGGLKAYAFPYAYGGYFLGQSNSPVANDSPISQIQSAASEAVNVVNSTVNNNNPISQAQNAASQLLASINIPSNFNTTTSGLNSFAIPSFSIPQIPAFSDVPVGNDRPVIPQGLSNFQSQLAVLVSQLKNETAPFPGNPSVQSDDILTKPQTNPASFAQLQPVTPVPEEHPLLTIFPQQVQSDSYFGLPSFNLPNNTFGQFINQLAGLASNFTGGASNATDANSTESSNAGTDPLQSIGNQITAGFSNVAEVITNGTAAIGTLGAQIANQTSSSNGTSTNNANGTSSALPDANQLGGALSQIISNGPSLITAPINSILSTNFSRAYNPALSNLYNQLSSVGGNETVTQVTNALSPAVLAGQLSGILSQLQASNPLASNDVSSSKQPDSNSNGILNWNTINNLPIISSWIGTNSNNKPITIAKPTLSCPVCQEVCGKVNSPAKLRQHRVVGGTAVDPANKYPWTTRFVYFNANAGQGSLINDRAVVTTATTVIGMPLFSQATALFNVYDTMSTTEQRFSKNLARVIPHPKFSPSNPFNNNIGIVILDSPVAMSEFIQPICLPTSFDSYAGTQAVVAGWGADSTGGHPSPVPHEVSIPLYSTAECKLANGNLTNKNLCGGVVQPAQPGSVKSTCEGDDGAGLMAPSRVDSSVLTLIGITIETPGDGCGSNNQPATFTNVQNYIDFILYNGIGCGC